MIRRLATGTRRCQHLAIMTVAAWLAISMIAASADASDSRSVRFQHASRDEGLSQSFVYAIVQDPQGYVWFGTQDGLNRFDGFEFRIFDHDPDDPTSISDESIRTMIRSGDGTLWIGTDAGGLSRYDPASESFTNYLHDADDRTSIANNRVRVLYEDSSASLWVGTDGSGLDQFDAQTGTFSHLTHDPDDANSLSSDHVWSIVEDSMGTLWVATDNGLNRYDPITQSFQRYQHDPNDPTSLRDNRLRVVFEDNDNILWVGTENGGISCFDRRTETFMHFTHDPDDPFSIPSNQINTMYQDDAGVLWIGTLQGLAAWDPATQHFDTYYNNPSDRFSLIHDNVASIFQDRAGVLWVGTYNGVSWWNQANRAVLHYRHDANDSTSLSEDTVMSFAEGADNSVWVATYGGGLNRLNRDDGSFTQLRHSPDDPSSISSDRVMSLMTDHEGAVWAGTRSAGLNRYDPVGQTFERFVHDPQDDTSISNNGITFIIEDSRQRVWAGTFGGGLNRYDRDSGKFVRYRHDDSVYRSISDDRAIVLFEDSEGDIWVGTYGGGLNHLEPDTGVFTHYRADRDAPDGLPGDEIYMIQEQSNGDFWIGVKGAGLVRWRLEDRRAGHGSFERFSLSDGLPNSTIYSGVWDQQGYLWISSGRGVSRLDTSTLQFTNYDTSHGLQGDEFNLSAGLVTRDRQLFFGGVTGFNAFYPDRLGGKKVAPQVVISSMLSMNEPTSLTDARRSGTAVMLDHTQKIVGFEYVALDYAAPSRNRYMYQLVGMDSDWIDAGNKRQVTYTNLAPGSYSFRVKAANNVGLWSTEFASVSFTVAPAPWLTWWAYTVYSIVLAALLALAFRSYANRAEHIAKIRFAEDFAVVQERLTQAQRIAGIGNFEHELDSDRMWWSDEVYRLLQVDRNSAEPSFESLLQRVHEDDRSKLQQVTRQILESKQAAEIEFRVVLPNGNLKHFQQRAEVAFDDQGQPLNISGTLHDITHQKMNENQIRDRASFQSLLAKLSSRLMMARTSDIAEPMQQGLELIGTHYDLDAISVWWFSDDKKATRSCHRWVREAEKNRQTQLNTNEMPWMAKRLLAGETVAINDLDDLPDEAAKERKMFWRRGIQSLLTIPLRDEERLLGACAYSILREPRPWSQKVIDDLKLIAETLGGAEARSRAVGAIEKLQKKLHVENLYLQDEIRLAHGFAEIIGEDRALKQSLMAVEKVAPTDVPVLIMGETGTGKELIARAVHKLSARRDRPLISVNCPALPADIIESELFGHEKGAFTGAHAQRLGRFELADTGTIFLDEIGELPIELQSKLLRVLQTGEFVRLGGTDTLQSNARVIAATNRDLQLAVANGEFRSDLFYRINSFPIRLPALRNRKGDIPLLAEHFVRKNADRLGKNIEAISAKMISALTRYSWPGNIRELESVIERALISSAGTTMLELPESLPSLPGALPEQKAASSAPSNGHADLSTAERLHIIGILEQTGWQISGDEGAAAALGLPPSTLRSKMKKLKIQRKS